MESRVDYASLTPGYEFPPCPLALDQASVQAYCAAVEDASPHHADLAAVPPTAVAALALRGVLEHMGMAPGAMHVSQELIFLRSIRVGEELTATARVAQSSVRGEWRWLTVDLEVTSHREGPAMTGRSVVLLPTGAGDGEA